MPSPPPPALFTDMVYDYAAHITNQTPNRVADTLLDTIGYLCALPPDDPVTPMNLLTRIEASLVRGRMFTPLVRTLYVNTLTLGYPGVPLTEASMAPIIDQTVDASPDYAFNPPPRVGCGSRDEREIYTVTNPACIMRVYELADTIIAMRALTHPPLPDIPLCLWQHTPTTTL